MDLLDKALGSFAASGEKRKSSGLTASDSSGRHLLAVEDTQANGSSVSPDDTATACRGRVNLLEKPKTCLSDTKTLTGSVISGFLPVVIWL